MALENYFLVPLFWDHGNHKVPETCYREILGFGLVALAPWVSCSFVVEHLD